MALIVVCVDGILTSQQITCIYNAWAVQGERPWLPWSSSAARLHYGTDWELAGSTYRIQPIQERAKRPLWTINNGASGFVSCLWEHRKRMREHVMKSGTRGGGGGPPIQFVVFLCAHSFLLYESIAVSDRYFSWTAKSEWPQCALAFLIIKSANKCWKQNTISLYPFVFILRPISVPRTCRTSHHLHFQSALLIVPHPLWIDFVHHQSCFFLPLNTWHFIVLSCYIVSCAH